MRQLFICLVLGLAGCTSMSISPVSHDCPKTVSYSAADLNQAADELTAMQDANHQPRYPMISRMMTDYGRERAALTPCQPAPTPAAATTKK